MDVDKPERVHAGTVPRRQRQFLASTPHQIYIETRFV